MKFKFSFTPSIVRHLQSIERVRELVRLTILPLMIAEQLRIRAHIRSTHYSTRIEGNRLTLKETEQVIQQGRLFPGRERDVREVEHYYLALQQVEKWVEGEQKITESRIRKLHALLFAGKRAKPTPYRDGQNVIRTSSGEIVYTPPEAEDVPGLMKDMVGWIHQSWPDLPVPVIAGVAHYQFVTIHPFYDGNGRAARTLTTWVLHQGGYDLGKFYSLEEFYAEDLNGYYDALVTHPHHNYYFGRNEADITTWIDYFVKGMSVVFERVADEVNSQAQGTVDDSTAVLLRPLDHRARRVLGLFVNQELIQSSDVANLLGISARQARDLLTDWVNQGWLEIADPSRRGRKYELAQEYKELLNL
ncbi:MAG: Fic family protein [Anaerolineales bacterium]|nr:Fic family protein [Chloroflexota bacterium]MBL6981345.1 Fic family protein [Anaerolineales bacterium]